ncbi:sialate O-acetylesterase [Fibrisoma montanum]|uniref:Sialate O-acetylesterase n=1 Tax=Fibrisoma montanum TaxID=2305895 RepID=A0A418MIE3_9BACT|nr:sialate O-acetylesterase [Fibrisoma montanum]RIV27187.1 sialate O-acetylesterase [Fibrisoma montanum]
MTYKCLALLAVLFLGTSLKQDVPTQLRLFLLIGQSNMAGRGAPEAQDQQPLDRVWMLTNEETWVPAREPMHFDKPAVVGVGPGFAFGKRIAEAFPDQNIGLIPCAVGGSGIDVWKPGAYYEPTKSYPYDDALRRARKALGTGKLAGILWHQGESDAKPDKAPTYGAKLAELIQRLRNDLNAPNVPVVVGTLGDFIVRRNPDAGVINETLQKLPGQVPNTYCVVAAGLIHKGDSTHFDTPSARTLGGRYADVFVQKNLLTRKDG